MEREFAQHGWIITKSSTIGSRRSYASEVKDKISLQNISVSAVTQLEMYCGVIVVHYSGSDW